MSNHGAGSEPVQRPRIAVSNASRFFLYAMIVGVVDNIHCGDAAIAMGPSLSAMFQQTSATGVISLCML